MGLQTHMGPDGLGHSLTFLQMKGRMLPHAAVPQPQASGEPNAWLALAPAQCGFSARLRGSGVALEFSK